MSKKRDPFDSAKRRLKRAQQHTMRLKKRMKTFVTKYPPVAHAETEADGSVLHAVKFVRQIPGSWEESAAEALESLRSALDQTGYAAAQLGGVPDPKHAYFPLADTAPDLDNVVKGRCKDLPAEIATLFRGFDAHERGNYALWTLHKLCNANKHRLLVPVGFHTDGAIFNVAIVVKPPVYILAPAWDREKNQVPFARVGPGGEFKYDANISFSVHFDPIYGPHGAPAGTMLEVICNFVADVIQRTEAECRRIGLLN
jgi:hypothetical protein